MNKENLFGTSLIFLLIGLVVGLTLGLTIEPTQIEKTTIFYSELCKRLEGTPNIDQGYCEILGEQVFFGKLLKYVRDEAK